MRRDRSGFLRLNRLERRIGDRKEGTSVDRTPKRRGIHFIIASPRVLLAPVFSYAHRTTTDYVLERVSFSRAICFST